jgi:hypothetical protein
MNFGNGIKHSNAGGIEGITLAKTPEPGSRCKEKSWSWVSIKTLGKNKKLDILEDVECFSR